MDVGLGARGRTAPQRDEYLIRQLADAWTLAQQQGGTNYSTLATVAGTPVTNTWMKIALQVVGTDLRGFVNGVQVVPASGATSDTQISGPDSASITISAIPAATSIWLDEVIVRRLVANEPTVALGALLWQ